MRKVRVTGEDQDLWRRLRTTGCPLRDDLQLDPMGLKIMQCNESLVLPLSRFTTAYILWVRAVNYRSKLVISRWELRLPWPDPGFDWLGDPLGETPWDQYFFPGDAPHYPRADVINHLRGCPLERGRVLEGALLGVGWKPIPAEFRHGQLAQAELSAVDQFDQKFSAEISLWVDRSSESSRRSSRKPATSCGLFERPELPVRTTARLAVTPGTPGPVDEPRGSFEGDSA